MSDYGRSILYNTGGRKFVVVLGCGIVTSVLLYLGKLDSAAYATIIVGTVGAYIAGDAYVSVRTGYGAASRIAGAGRPARPQEAGYGGDSP